MEDVVPMGVVTLTSDRRKPRPPRKTNLDPASPLIRSRARIVPHGGTGGRGGGSPRATWGHRVSADDPPTDPSTLPTTARLPAHRGQTKSAPP